MWNSTMNNELTTTLFGRRGAMHEINADTLTRRQRGGHTNEKIVLDNAVRRNSITQRQRKCIEVVFGNTIRGRGTWSISAADSLEKSTKNSQRPIVAELRPQGSGIRTRMVIGGRIYFDISTKTDTEYLAKSVFEGTDVFRNSKLNWNDQADKAVIIALVVGLFTRPRMASWIRVDITEGSTTEASPRCISERALGELRAREAQKARLLEEEASQQIARMAKKAKFVAWASTFVPIARAEASREAGWSALLEEEVPDNWDD